MNIVYLGTDYGGWSVDIDSIDDGSTIIDAGLGEDISFLERLSSLRNVNIIGVDPTEKSHKYVSSRSLSNLSLVKSAIAPKGIDKVTLFKNTNPSHVSESYCSEHGSVGSEAYQSDAVSFSSLISRYSPTLVKMDIEGAEYDVLEECIGVKQICVEFHHHCIKNKTFEDTLRQIKKLESAGYTQIACKNQIEYTFILRQ